MGSVLGNDNHSINHSTSPYLHGVTVLRGFSFSCLNIDLGAQIQALKVEKLGLLKLYCLKAGGSGLLEETG